ncbi:MAG: hypothetical protein ACU0B9_07285 [Limimaricola soesokkakensis]|uniref:hypothetical protein n=1 Tax=Limimaricola soesokkakensis TaxID=1343159 RepID=UPI00405870EA
MMWIKSITVIALWLGVWQKYKAMGKPIVRGGRRWWRQPDGRYSRWHGMGLRHEKDLPPD